MSLNLFFFFFLQCFLGMCQFPFELKFVNFLIVQKKEIKCCTFSFPFCLFGVTQTKLMVGGR